MRQVSKFDLMPDYYYYYYYYSFKIFKVVLWSRRSQSSLVNAETVEPDTTVAGYVPLQQL
jgi:hypothetical protein